MICRLASLIPGIPSVQGPERNEPSRTYSAKRESNTVLRVVIFWLVSDLHLDATYFSVRSLPHIYTANLGM